MRLSPILDVYRRRMSGLKAALQWAMLAGALALLNASLTFENAWPTLSIRWTAALSIEVALCVLAIVVAVRWFRAPPVAVRILAAIWVVLVIGRYEDVTARSLYGRDINLYWDARNLPSVGAMLSSVAKPWLVAATIAGVSLVPLIIYLPLGGRSAALRMRRKTRASGVLTAVAGAVLVVGVAQGLGVPVPGGLHVVEPVTAVYARQARMFTYEISGAGLRALPPAPPMRSNLGLVKGADVLLVLESCGAVSWDRPALVEALAASRTRLDADIRDTGRRVVSALVESTTFGGKSWLAHISLLSGTEVRDEQTSVRLMSQRRETMVSAFSRQGYRTVAIMPGVRAAWPEGAFYGFDEIYDVARLDYQGRHSAGGTLPISSQSLGWMRSRLRHAPASRCSSSSRRSARTRRSHRPRRASRTGVESSHAPPMTMRSWPAPGHRSPTGSIWGRVTHRRSTTPTRRLVAIFAFVRIATS